MKPLSATHLKLGQKIKVLRKELNLTQENLAEIIDVDRSYMGFVERGERNVTLSKMMKIAKALKVSVRELIDP